MPFSSGAYSAPANSWNPAVAATTINETDWASLLADLTTALSTCMLKDGTQVITANLPMAGFKFTGLGAGASNGDSVRYEQLPTTGTQASTFTFDGSGGSTGSVTMTYEKSVAGFVKLHIPTLSATTGTGSVSLTSNTALPAAIRPPTNAQHVPVMVIINNNAAVTNPGFISIATTGIITLRRDGASTAFTNSATAGTSAPISILYFIG